MADRRLAMVKPRNGNANVAENVQYLVLFGWVVVRVCAFVCVRARVRKGKVKIGND